MAIPQSEPRRSRDGAQVHDTRQQPHPEQRLTDYPDDLPHLDHRVRQAVELMSQDLSRRWTLDDLAALVGLGPNHLGTLFKAATGFAPLQLLKALRLERARRLLGETSESVARIAERVGYEVDTGHFYRDFKAQYNLTPAAFRRRGPDFEW
jgi:AraC family transcriptional regulator, arabinose operon regulatory protein